MEPAVGATGVRAYYVYAERRLDQTNKILLPSQANHRFAQTVVQSAAMADMSHAAWRSSRAPGRPGRTSER
jgi:hypothetical protein